MKIKGLKLKRKKETGKKITLSEKQIDSLMELGNIGAGNAVIALSKLINKTIDMSLTGVNLIPFNEFSNILGDPKIKALGILSEIKGKAPLSIIQIFTKKSIVNLIDEIGKVKGVESLDELESIDDLNDEARDLISEIGSILTGAYCSALANLMSIKLIPEVPRLELAPITSIANNLLKKHTKKVDSMLGINTKLSIEDLKIQGLLCLIPSVKTLNILFKLISF